MCTHRFQAEAVVREDEHAPDEARDDDNERSDEYDVDSRIEHRQVELVEPLVELWVDLYPYAVCEDDYRDYLKTMRAVLSNCTIQKSREFHYNDGIQSSNSRPSSDNGVLEVFQSAISSSEVFVPGAKSPLH